MGVKTVAAVPHLPTSDLPFLAEFGRVLDRLGFSEEHGDWLAALMSHESGFNAQAKNMVNPDKGAVGIMQFMPQTAKGLGAGKTPEEARANILKMTRTEQLKYVEKYFAPWRGGLMRPVDIPIAGAGTAYVGKPLDYVIGVKGSPVPTEARIYEQNRGLDRNKNGIITLGEIVDDVGAVLERSEGLPRVLIPGAGAPGTTEKKGGSPFFLFGLGAAILGALAIFKRKDPPPNV